MNIDTKIAYEMIDNARDLLFQFRLASPSENPYLIILGGQPGSGKTTGILSIEQEGRFKKNIIPLCNDDFKPMYPGYLDILSKDRIGTSHIVQPYANFVVDELKKEFSDMNYNLIIEGTMRTSEVPLSTVNELKAKGYKAEAYVIAANYYASRVGCLNRQEEEIQRIGTGRAVPIDKHDEAYTNIPNTLKSLINSGKLDDIKVLNRAGNIIGNLSLGENIVSIYEEQRNRLSPDEYSQINTD